MQIHIVSSLARPVASLWQKYQKVYGDKGKFIVAAPISNTPIPIYEWITQHAHKFVHWSTFQFLMMDEQVVQDETGDFSYISEHDPASFERKIKHMFLARVEKALDMEDHEPLLTESIIKPNLNELTLVMEQKNRKKSFLDKKIAEHLGIDLLILAIGEEGHYAQVLPGTPKDVGFHISPLLESYKAKHQRSGTFLGAQFQTYGMSLGPQQVLSAKHVIVIISGENKRALTKQLLSYTSFDPQFPLSIIYDPEVRDRVEVFITKEVMDEDLRLKLM